MFIGSSQNISGWLSIKMFGRRNARMSITSNEIREPGQQSFLHKKITIFICKLPHRITRNFCHKLINLKKYSKTAPKHS
jgi:hypothetical protein